MPDIDLQQTVRTTELPLLQRALGSFWGEQYEDQQVVRTICQGLYGQLVQADVDLKERLLVARDLPNAPLFHRQVWYRLLLNEDDMLDVAPRPWLYSPSNPQYGPDNPMYGQAFPPLWSFRTPQSLRLVRCVTDRLTDPKALWYGGHDLWYSPGVLGLRTNPLSSPDFEQLQVRGKPGVALWLYQSDWDLGLLQSQYGIPLQATAASTEEYRLLCQALWSLRVRGSNRRDVNRLISSCTGVPLCREEGETVELLESDPLELRIVTDRRVYRFPSSHQPVVQQGQQLIEGQALTDSLTVQDLAMIRPGGLPVMVPPSFFPIGANVKGSLLFPNEQTALTDLGLSPGGRRRLGFQLYGDATDISNYLAWAADQGLARAWDFRGPDASSEPQMENLPAQINPVTDLLQRLMRPNLLIISGRPDRWPAAADLQQQLERHLYQAIPPHGRAILQDQNQIDQLLTP